MDGRAAIRRGGTALHWAGRAAVIALLLLPFIDFLRVSLPRLFHPFELEWLEGELAMYSKRFLERPTLGYLYPVFEEGAYSPHLYPPTFQILAALVFKLLVSPIAWLLGRDPAFALLGAGRLVSFVATLGTMAAIGCIVRDRARGAFPPVAAALAYPMFYKICGYWYDLFRVDSLACCLAMWSVRMLLLPRARRGTLAAAVALAALAAFTKQTYALIPAAAGGVRCAAGLWQVLAARFGARPFARREDMQAHPLALWAIGPAVLAGALLLLALLAGSALPRVKFFLWEMPSKHGVYFPILQNQGRQGLFQYFIWPMLLIPAGAWCAVLGQRWRGFTVAGRLAAAGWCAAAYVLWLYRGGATGFAPLWAGEAAISLAVVLRLLRRDGSALPAGALCAGVFAALASYSALYDWNNVPARTGGALENLFNVGVVCSLWPLPLKACAAATLGAAVAWAIRFAAYRTALPGGGWLALLFAFQAVAAVSWVKIGGYINNFMPLLAVFGVAAGFALAWIDRYGARCLGRGGAGVLVGGAAAAMWIGWFGNRPAEMPELDKMPYEQTATVPPWTTDGLRWDTKERPLGRQRPDLPPFDVTREWGPKLLARVAELHRDGGVYLPNNNFFGTLAGVPPGASIDAIRDVTYAGKPTPEPILQALRTKKVRHIVTMFGADGGWLTEEFRRELHAHYDFAGELLPGMPWAACMPNTGAPVKPAFYFRAKE